MTKSKILSTKSCGVEVANLSPALAEFANLMQDRLDVKYRTYGDSYGSMNHAALLKFLDDVVEKAKDRYAERNGWERTHFITGGIKNDMVDIANIAMMIALNEKRRRG